jgi:hypothetical protein
MHNFRRHLRLITFREMVKQNFDTRKYSTLIATTHMSAIMTYMDADSPVSCPILIFIKLDLSDLLSSICGP